MDRHIVSVMILYACNVVLFSTLRLCLKVSQSRDGLENSRLPSGLTRARLESDDKPNTL